MKRYYKFFIVCVMTLSTINCTKFLEQKPDKKLAVPENLEDLEAILNNSALFNIRNFGLGEASSDNVFVSNSIWNALSEEQREIYIWGENIMPESNRFNPWADAYQIIYYSNSILEVIDDKFKGVNSQRVNEVKGKALFFRAFYYLSLTMTWAPAFDETNADLPKGVPLRLNSDFNIKSKRATVRECYDQIERDLLESIELLPQNVELPWSPSLSAGYALLSRMYMAMRRYDQAEIYSTKVLEMDDSLMDFNDLNENDRYSIPRLNKEILFNAYGGTVVYNIVLNAVLDDIYINFDDMDLRKKHFFFQRPDGTQRFRGSYAVNADIFTGLATNEMFLNKAEVLVRNGDISKGLSILNRLLVTRWEKDEFIPFSTNNGEEALRLVLEERRKELLFRDLRWSDLKRLNKEDRFQITLKREINDIKYELSPNDQRYEMPLPQNVIDVLK